MGVSPGQENGGRQELEVYIKPEGPITKSVGTLGGGTVTKFALTKQGPHVTSGGPDEVVAGPWPIEARGMVDVKASNKHDRKDMMTVEQEGSLKEVTARDS